MLRRVFFQLSVLPVLAAPKRLVAVIAHRGEHLRHPENSIPAIQAAIDAGADYVEVDVRTTKDGALVLMHNSTVDRQTDGKGEVREMTLAEIRALDCGVRFDAKFAGTRVPLFDEALEVLRGKCGLYLDWKAASAEALAAALRRHGMLERTVVYGAPDELDGLLKLEPTVRVMPEARSVVALQRLLTSLRPPVVAFNDQDFLDPIIRLAREAKADVYVDRLGANDNPAAWGDAVRRGATGIQTDHPAELAEFLAKL